MIEIFWWQTTSFTNPYNVLSNHIPSPMLDTTPITSNELGELGTTVSSSPLHAKRADTEAVAAMARNLGPGR